MEVIDRKIEQVKAVNELEQLNRMYAMLTQINRTIIRVESPQELYEAVCRIAFESGGFGLAWIGLLGPGYAEVTPVASAGAASITQLKHIGEEIEDFGFRTGAAFPIRLESNIVGALNLAATEPDFFCDTKLTLLNEAVDDISFALSMLRQMEQRIAMESKMRYLTNYDSQTGLPSRALFEERLIEACQNPTTGQVAVLVPHLLKFHEITLLFGTDAGQFIFRAMSTRLETLLPSMTIARLNESKFGVILINPVGLDSVEELAWQIHQTLSDPIKLDGKALFLEPFVGISVFPQDGKPLDVLKYAMHASRRPDDKSSCRFFVSDMDQQSLVRLNLDSALRAALKLGEFVLHYQPQIDLASGQIIGAEALLRWQSSEYGLVSPQDFIPLLEENGLINDVGEWVLREACMYALRRQQDGLPPLRIAVNLSAKQFQNNDIQTMVGRVLAETGLEPKWLELELTESTVLHDTANVIQAMRNLNANGICFALDDFGTGYSSLSYLQRLPVARIKIDRSFVINVTSNPSDAAIVRAVVGMAHSLGMRVIAEGVETEGQLGFLRGVGCEEIQGYYFSRPLPGNEFTALLRESRGIPPAKVDKPERVLLLVDDEPNILSALVRTLRRRGFHILSTTSTREAFDLLATQKPGVVISDQRMPELTGTEFLRRVKEIYPDTVRMVLSGYAELNSVISAVNQGSVYKFLTKPWEDDVLIESIEDAFRIYELNQEKSKLALQN
ncbi:EAL domain-containing protein [Methylomonas sp. MgM2]